MNFNASQKENFNMQNLLDRLTDTYYKADETGKIIEISASIESLLGYKQEEMIGQSIKDFYLNPDERQTKLANFNQSKRSQLIEAQLKHKDGKSIWVAANSQEWYKNDGSFGGIEGVIRNVDNEKKLFYELKKSEERFRTLFKISPAGIVYFDTQGIIIDCNDAALQIFGATHKQLCGFNLLQKLQNKALLLEIKKVLKEGKARFQGYYQSITGKQKSYIDVDLQAVRNEKGEIVFAMGLLFDRLIEKQAIEQAKNESLRTQRYLDIVPIIIVSLDDQAKVLRINKRGVELLGKSEIEVLGKNWFSLILSDKEQAAAIKTFNDMMQKSIIMPEYQENTIITPTGEHIIAWHNKTIKDGNGKLTGILSAGEDITKIRYSEKQLHYLAFNDSLLNIPNRFLLKERISNAINRSQRNKGKFAVIFLDLDDFKLINDTYGHDEGDNVLKMTTERLQNIIRKEDTLARFGGDEFVILMESINTAEIVANIAQKILGVFEKPFNVDNKPHFLGISIGISIYPDDATNSDILISSADAAMYHAKRKGGNRFEFFTKGLTKTLQKRIRFEVELREAIELKQFVLYYQPQINLQTQKISGFEVLIRWENPKTGLIFPDEFISILEQNRLIIPLTRWILIQACSQAKSWIDEGLFDGKIVVNISGVHMENGNIVGDIQEALEISKLPSKYLEVEITESVLMMNANKWKDIFLQIRKMDISISIDDFGTGYSSLSYLNTFPLNILKIDKSFIDNLATHTDSRAIAKTIISLAKSLNLHTLAEGVESVEQLQWLKSHKCDFAQGYYYSRPLSADKATQYLNDNT